MSRSGLSAKLAMTLLKSASPPEADASLIMLPIEIFRAELIGTPERTIETMGLLSVVSGALRTG